MIAWCRSAPGERWPLSEESRTTRQHSQLTGVVEYFGRRSVGKNRWNRDKLAEPDQELDESLHSALLEGGEKKAALEGAAGEGDQSIDAPLSIQAPSRSRSSWVMLVMLPSGMIWLATDCAWIFAAC